MKYKLLLTLILLVFILNNRIPEMQFTNIPLFKQVNKYLDNPALNQHTDEYQKLYLKRLIKFKQTEGGDGNKGDNDSDQRTIKRFYPRITPYTMAFYINNRRYYSLTRMAYNYVIRTKYSEYANSSRLRNIELNYSLKLMVIMIVDLVLSYKNYDFVISRIYNVLRTVNVNENKPMDSEKIGTTMLVLKNIMDSLKPILYEVLYMFKDMNEPNTWDPFYKPRIFRLAIDLNLIESEEDKEKRRLEIIAQSELERENKCMESCQHNCQLKCSESAKEKGKEKENVSNKNNRFSQSKHNENAIKSRIHKLYKQHYERLMVDMYKDRIKYNLQHDSKGNYHKDWKFSSLVNSDRNKSINKTKKYLLSSIEANSVYTNKMTAAKTVKLNKNSFRFTESTSQTSFHSKSIEEEIEFEETFNNNRNYVLIILTSIMIIINIFKIFSLICIAIVMFAIEEKDQQQLISDQMIVDQFTQVFYNIEDSLIDEDSLETFNLVQACFFYPEVVFKNKIQTVENIWELINPLLSSLQSNFIKNIFIRHLSGLIFGITRFYAGEMFINYADYFSQKNILIMCEKYKLDSYWKSIHHPELVEAQGETPKEDKKDQKQSRFKVLKLDKNSQKFKDLTSDKNKVESTIKDISFQHNEMEFELEKQQNFLNSMNDKLAKLYKKIGINKSYQVEAKSETEKNMRVNK